MSQHTREKSPLSVHRAFVVYLSTRADVIRGQWEGKAEHIVSGQVTHFHSLDDLAGFITRVLTKKKEG
jgi:hypothetical protein